MYTELELMDELFCNLHSTCLYVLILLLIFGSLDAEK